MSQVFEDAFMDFQSSLISLCMEAVGTKVDKIYAYCSNEKKSKMFNVFFKVKNAVKKLNEIDISSETQIQLLKIGTKDLPKLDKLCEEYSKPVPREIKMIYDVKNGKFDASYKYDEVCTPQSGIAAEDVFRQWRDEIKNS